MKKIKLFNVYHTYEVSKEQKELILKKEAIRVYLVNFEGVVFIPKNVFDKKIINITIYAEKHTIGYVIGRRGSNIESTIANIIHDLNLEDVKINIDVKPKKININELDDPYEIFSYLNDFLWCEESNYVTIIYNDDSKKQMDYIHVGNLGNEDKIEVERLRENSNLIPNYFSNIKAIKHKNSSNDLIIIK